MYLQIDVINYLGTVILISMISTLTNGRHPQGSLEGLPPLQHSYTTL
jgi:hypothetical protein